jgi:hypothetical protein
MDTQQPTKEDLDELKKITIEKLGFKEKLGSKIEFGIQSSQDYFVFSITIDQNRKYCCILCSSLFQRVKAHLGPKHKYNMFFIFYEH